MLKEPKRLKTHQGLKAAHKHAPIHEKQVAKRLGGKVTVGSGNKHEKGDVRIRGVMRVECKCTEKKSFSVTRDMLLKIEAAATAAGELPAMEIRFINGKRQTEAAYAVVPIEVLDMLVKVKNDGLAAQLDSQREPAGGEAATADRTAHLEIVA